MPSIKATLMDDSKIEYFRSKFFDISDDGKFDMKNLLPYVYIALNMKIDMKNQSLETEALFRECTWEDFSQFKNKGVEDDLSIGHKHNFTTNRFCPAFETVDKDLIVRNFYSDIKDRESFSIEIRKCT